MLETETSKQDWDAFLKWEKDKHDNFFVPYYKENGFELIKDFVGINWHWDVEIKKDDKILRVDEKARQREYDDFLVEVFQCLKTGKIGWLYKPKDIYFYASWEIMSGSTAIDPPNSAYWINSHRLIDFVVENFDDLESVISEKGYGLTYNKKAKWDDLIYLKIAQKIL